MAAVIYLTRSPLKEGESVYAQGNISQGVFEGGNHDGEEKPTLHCVLPSVNDKGEMTWKMLDCKKNRDLCEKLLPTIENPSFSYSYELIDEDGKQEIADPKFSDSELDLEKPKSEPKVKEPVTKKAK